MASRALRGFDIDRYRPELLGIEVAAENVGAVMTYLASHGYERLEKYLDYDTINWYFAPTHPPE